MLEILTFFYEQCITHSKIQPLQKHDDAEKAEWPKDFEDRIYCVCILDLPLYDFWACYELQKSKLFSLVKWGSSRIL